MDEKTSRILEQFVANPTLTEMKDISNNGYGITQEYNSVNRYKLWDSTRDKKEFRESIFKGRKIFDDPVSGQKLHSTQKTAQNKYHMKNQFGENSSTAWANHSPETDHIVPLKEIHNRVKSNPFLSDADVKEVANNPDNYRVTSKSFNASKGKKSDFEFAFDKHNEISKDGRAKLVKEKLGAEASITTRFAARTVKNVGTEFTEGAVFSLEASVVPLIVEGVSNLCKVANGEKEFNEAAKDMGKLTMSVAVSGGTIRVVSTGVTNLMKNSGKEALEKVANSNQVMQVITVSLIVKDSVIKYVNGEIDSKHFFEEIGEKGVGMLTGTIGAIAGQALIPIPVVGAAIGSMIVSTVCLDLYKSIRTLNKFQKIENSVSGLASDALTEMNRQQEILKQLIKEEFYEWDEEFNKGYEMIYTGTIEDSTATINQGLSCILSVFSKDIAFKSQKEFDDLFFDNNSVFNM
ncbi:hypothetical protein P4604_10870 [Lysinibacillus capsici]|uniref:hypothetical protein n=1 Tax=Lysinibacillus capsici TaxID=2115968 RepID=UPI002E21279C|nr:hypothetical protein [Lysinibacillus capsici]